MKKIFSSILISFILLLNISMPVSVLAAVPTIKLNLVNEQQNGENGQWSWVFDIKTTNIPDGEVVTLGLSKNGVKEGLLIKEKIKNNSGSFYTDSTDTNGKPGAVLLPLTKYLVVAVYLNATDSFEKTTPEGIKPDIIKQGNPYTAIGSTATKDTPVPVTPKINATENKSIYTMLAPIGGIERMDSSGTDPTCAADPKCITNDIGKYLNIIFKLAIGICAALAVIMLIINGVKYMGDESVFGKTEAKKQMFGAIVGLLIALGAWALLNTINPALTGQGGLNISSANVEIVNLPDAGDRTVDPDFKNQTGTYSTSTVSPSVQSAVDKIKNGMSIKSFNINTSSKKMVIAFQNGTLSDYSSPIDINIGKGGASEIGSGVTGDTKTPKGSWKILEIRTSKENKPVFNKTGSNMGASFWLLSPTTNGDRGIGMHGDKSGTTSNATIGCIKLKNSDILALLPYVKAGIPVNIQ